MRLYNSYTDTALRVSEGDQQKADYFLKCSAYEYEYRLLAHNRYIEWHNKKIKEQIKK